MGASSVSQLVVAELFAILVVYARLGAALLLLPAFGESYVSPRLRLWLGLLTSVLVAGALGDRLPGPMLEGARLAGLIGGEVLVGLAIGTVLRLSLAALQVAGTIVALQSGLAAALFFDPSEATQGTVPGALLATLFLVVLVTSDTHHLLLARVVAGYDALPVGAPLPSGDMLGLAAEIGNAAFAVGLAIAGPVLLVAFLANLALGLLARLVPTLQVLFVALPLQLLLALATMVVAVGGGITAAFALLDRSSAWLGS